MTTQDSLPAAGQALPDGLSTRRVPTKGFKLTSCSSSSSSKLSWRKVRPVVKASVGYSEDFDEFYTYDGLHRLATLDRGELDGDPPTGIKSSSPAPTFTEDWTLDALGNWGTFKWDDDGGGGLAWGICEMLLQSQVRIDDGR